MSEDYSTSKPGIGAVWPDNAVSSPWVRVEPLVTAAQVRSRHLFGLSLVSDQVDPLTKRRAVYTDDMIRDDIDRAVALAETNIGIDIFPVQGKEKQPFSREDYMSFGYYVLNHRPVASIEKLEILPPSGGSIYTVQKDWIETGMFHQGQVNLIPIGNAIAYSAVPDVGSAGALFLSVFASQNWVPAFWCTTYTSGFPSGQVPKVVNEYIGTVAAMIILSQMAATNAKNAGHSLSLDGGSQSISSPGAGLYKPRLDDLSVKEEQLRKKLKTLFGLKLFSGTPKPCAFDLCEKAKKTAVSSLSPWLLSKTGSCSWASGATTTAGAARAGMQSQARFH